MNKQLFKDLKQSLNEAIEYANEDVAINKRLLQHEVLDRGMVICDTLSEKVLDHEFFNDKAELKQEGEEILSQLYNFITKCGE